MAEPPRGQLNIKKIRRLMRKYNSQCPIQSNSSRMAKVMATVYTALNIGNRESDSHDLRKILSNRYHV